jgi:phosphoglycolate phosphatase
MSQHKELIIFDWDGTLIDSQANIVQCFQFVIDELELPSRSNDEISNIIGLGMREALRVLFPQHDTDDYEQMVDRYRYHFFASDPSQPFSGAEDVLVDLSKAGYILAVATGKGRNGLNKALKHTGFGQYFHLSRCADETRSKPHPLMLEEILNETGMEPEKAVMVGDTEYDLEMAKNAGISSIGVSYGVHDSERLLKHEPITVINEIRALLNWFSGEKIAIS